MGRQPAYPLQGHYGFRAEEGPTKVLLRAKTVVFAIGAYSSRRYTMTQSGSAQSAKNVVLSHPTEVAKVIEEAASGERASTATQ
jgi:hypothetical protein